MQIEFSTELGPLDGCQCDQTALCVPGDDNAVLLQEVGWPVMLKANLGDAVGVRYGVVPISKARLVRVGLRTFFVSSKLPITPR